MGLCSVDQLCPHVEGLVAYDDLFVLLDSLFILVLVRRRLEDSNTMMVDIGEDLPSAPYHWTRRALTLCLNKLTSSSVRVSALAMTGIKLTFWWSLLMNSISMGLSLDVSCESQRGESSLRMTGRLNKVDTSVYTVINQFEPVDPVFLLEVSVESSVDIVDNWFPAAYQLDCWYSKGQLTFHRCLRNHQIRGYRPQST